MSRGDVQTVYDCIVIGGGSAGCVVAARLSEQANQSVLLLEAGSDSDKYRPGSPLRDASRLVLEGYNWDYEANVRGPDRFGTWMHNRASVTGLEHSRLKKPFGYRLGKVLGGSSAVNGAVALRGFPSDFERWAAMGCPDWSWSQVLPWFKRMETDVDFQSAAIHGAEGPLHLRRPPPQDIHPLDRAFAEACTVLGMPYIDDINVGEQPAVGPVPANIINGAERMDLFHVYLAPVLGRNNLCVRTDTQAERIEFAGRTAVAVHAVQNGRRFRFAARRIVLCAGAIGSAALLQRSGVGDPDHLQTLGIPVIRAAPAVGCHLQDHASLVLWAKPKVGVCTQGLPWRQVVARASSGYDEQVDVQLGLLNNVDSTTVPGFRDRVDCPMLVGASVMLMRPRAEGRVYLTSREPDDLPNIDLPLSRNEEDISRMMGGVRKVWCALVDPGVNQYLDDIQFWSDATMDNDTVVRSAVRNLMNPGWHASGTLRMGAIDDPQCVTAEDGRVHGVQGLWVADASLFPTLPSMPTNLTTVMTAERIAHFLTMEAAHDACA